jgi:hypothetical protein
VYDYWLGGTHNFLADQDAGRAVLAVDANVGAIARANRAFLGRAVRFLAASGIRQFLDIGSGIPTQGNVHEIAQQAAPGSRVVYVDTDPIAVAHSEAILAANQHATIINADLREPEKILAHPGTRSMIDFARPTGLLLSAVLHFIGDADDPWRIQAKLRKAVAPGSYIVVSHATDEGNTAAAQVTAAVYKRSIPAAGRFRSRPEILRFFDGFDLVDPGLVNVPLWRPDSADDMPADPGSIWFLGGVGSMSWPQLAYGSGSYD